MAARLRTRRFPRNVRVEEAPGGVLSLAAIWQQEDHIWLIDAVLSGQVAGSVTVLDEKALFSSPRFHNSTHHLSLSESLYWLCQSYPEMMRVHYRLWGIEARDTSIGSGLSPSVAEAVERAADQVFKEATLLVQ